MAKLRGKWALGIQPRNFTWFIKDQLAVCERPGGFGEKSTPGSAVRTDWKTPDIWLRRTFELPAGKHQELYLAIHHDEGAEVYLNGVLAAKTSGYITDYTLVAIDEAAVKGLREGKNTLAVHCHQTGGGQYIDVGLVEMREIAAKPR